MSEMCLSLCDNRHELPTRMRSIYPAVIDFSDLEEIDLLADLWACRMKVDGYDLVLYVQGVQYPLVAVINACVRRDVKLTLMHHRPDGTWYAQKVYRREE